MKPNKKREFFLRKPKDKCHTYDMHSHWSCPCFIGLWNKMQLTLIFINKDEFKGHNIYLDISNFFENPDKTNNMFSGGILGDD